MANLSKSGFDMLGIGYHRVPTALERVKPAGRWLVVLEKLARGSKADLILPSAKNTTRGRVLAVGPIAADENDIHVGDEVLYEEYMGGRWQFPTTSGGEARVLIMHSDWVLMGIRRR